MSLKALHKTGRKSVKEYVTENRYVTPIATYKLPIILGYIDDMRGSIDTNVYVDIVWDAGSYQLRYFSPKYGLIKKEKIPRDLAFYMIKNRIKKDKDLDGSHIPRINVSKLRFDSYVQVQKDKE